MSRGTIQAEETRTKDQHGQEHSEGVIEWLSKPEDLVDCQLCMKQKVRWLQT